MKNLVIGSRITFDFSSDGVEDIEKCCSDPDTGDLYIYSKGNVYRHLANESRNLTLLVECKLQFPDTIPNLIGMCYNLSLCLSFDNGDVVTVDSSGDWQIVGCVSSGIAAWEWSPDQELLALVTSNEEVVLMTASFDPIVEVPLRGDTFGEQQFVNVGWGKRETQFQGSAGKAAATAAPEPIAAVTDDDGRPRVTWRGDGALFAVGALEPNGQRCVRVFSREAVLQYTSAEVPGMEGSLSWRPSGNLVASTQRLPNKHVVVLLEKNGLRHGDFTLPFAPGRAKVMLLAWSTDSAVLAVWLVADGNSVVQLWTTGNFHWYLKQSMTFAAEAVRYVGWHGDELRVATAEGGVRRWRFLALTSRCGAGQSAAVVDGTRLLLSCFRQAVPPPPMASRQLALSAPINQLACAEHAQDHVFVHAADDRLYVLRPSEESASAMESTELEWSGEAKVSELHHWLWLSANQLVACRSADLASFVVWAKLEGNQLVQTDETAVAGLVTHLVSSAEAALAQLSDGSVLRLPTRGPPQPLHRLAEPCDELAAGGGALIALSRAHRLYLDGRLVARNVTSAIARTPFLLATTLQHRLVCARLDRLRTGETLDCSESAGRRVERGSRLVAAPAEDTRVIAQAPRGSLETVQPRALCLDVIARDLDAGRYRAAFLLARRQRISLGLLADHRPLRFLRDAELFVQQVSDPAWLSLFVSELRDEDVTQTLYASHYQHYPAPAPAPESLSEPVAPAEETTPATESAQVKSKVHEVCARLRQAMRASEDAPRLLQPILASYVRQGNMDKALLLTRDDAPGLKFLSCLVDVNQLFDTALGLYDLELAAFVAAHSQKDPKEYLPFLNQLRTMEPDFRRYSIDVHLRRPALALAHIARCGPAHLDACFALVEQHALHKQALSVFPAGSEGYRRACMALAAVLAARRRHAEAAQLLRRAGALPAALDAAVDARDWRAAISIARQIGLSGGEIQALCRSRLAPALAGAGEHAAAAAMFSALADVEEAVAALALASRWDHALWEAETAARLDLVETHVRPAAESSLLRLRGQLADARTQFDRHRLRLSVVRAGPRTYGHPEAGDGHADDCDLFSDRSTLRSVTSRGSRSSGKSRRRAERKQLSLREGGPFEGQALVRTLHALVTATSALTGEVSPLCSLLVRWQRDADAGALQAALADLLEHMRQHCSDIWTPALASATGATTFGPEATTESILAAMSLGGPPPDTALIEPEMRFAPSIANPSSWQLEML